MTTRGHCLCKQTSWEFEGDVDWSCYCHCDDCRRNCSAPVVAWFGVPSDRFRWTGAAPKTYASSPGVRRRFCGTCGTPMAFEADHYPGVMNLYTASLEHPETLAPQFHVYTQGALPWLSLSDDLDRHEGTLRNSPDATAP